MEQKGERRDEHFQVGRAVARDGGPVRSLRTAASWQQGIPTDGQDPTASAWRYLALCGDYDPDLFFPIGSSGPAARQRLRAKAVCAQCPVQRDCLEGAQATEQPYGV